MIRGVTLRQSKESPTKQPLPDINYLSKSSSPVDIMNRTNKYEISNNRTKQELILQPNFKRTRQSSNNASLRSVQSFYSCKSGDEDYFSVCSDSSSFKDANFKE
ncbi:uncharacterized protein LOC115884841 isoform X2 [Sitophilus oryzae]|uniref:Uncharacterized protein LOC115884841 isoform X2 n=1 Tax=Sitophilus oryzae TaxID=7048 RepID=A0A6J2Y8Y6_SITOR|nr:uncharacterized protein LOC115884841 isoform X2 [Sitophilus oryzae]